MPGVYKTVSEQVRLCLWHDSWEVCSSSSERRPVSLRTKLSSDSFVLTGQPSSPGLKHTRKRTLLQLRHGPVSLGVTQGTWISGHVKLLFRKPFHLTNSRQVP